MKFLSVFIAACMLVLANGQIFNGAGPCGSTVTKVAVELPKDYICKCQCRVQLTVTHPAEGCGFPGPYPAIIFSSGFQATAENYKPYAQRLSSWGFAVVQYDFLRLSPWIDQLCHSDAAEAGFMLKFLDQLRDAAADPASPLNGKLDLNNLGAAGHSRGAKIAALHFAGTTPNVKAAYLVDPVDGFSMTKGRLGYPSATMLLKDRSKKLGITAAGRIALCNGAPFATGNWTNFWEVASPGSELNVVLNAGHLQFAEINNAWNGVCCTGCTGLLSQQEGIELTLGPMVAWFQKELRGVNGALSLPEEPAFKSWACSNQQAHKLFYVVRGRGQVCGTDASTPPIEGLNLESASIADFGAAMVSGEGAGVEKAAVTPLFKLETQITSSKPEAQYTPLLHVDSKWGH